LAYEASEWSDLFVAAAVILAIFVAVANAWVLLVKILR
jgi:hypothetical protein